MHEAREQRFPGGPAAWWSVLALIVAFTARRYEAAWFSYALDGYSDEPAVVDPALAAARGFFRPHEFLYPGWTAYTLGALYKLLDVFGFGGEAGFTPQSAGPDHLVVGRLYIFAISLATLVVTALIGRRVAGWWCGLSAAALLACSPLFTGQSFIVTINPPASLWTALATLFALRIFQEGRQPRDYVLSGMCAGLAVACKYNSYSACFAPAVAHVLAPRVDGSRRDRWLIVAGIVAPAVFFLTTPYALIEWNRFLGDALSLGEIYSQKWTLHYNESGRTWGDYVVRMFKSGWPREMLVAAAIGGVLALAKSWKRTAILVVAPLFNYLFLGFYTVYFLRHLTPVLPALAVLTGALVQRVVDLVEGEGQGASKWRKRAGSAAAVALIAMLGARAWIESEQKVLHSTMLDSRDAAAAWIEEHLPEGARIVVEGRSIGIENSRKGYDVRVLRSIIQPDRTREVEQYDYVVLSSAVQRKSRDPRWAASRQAYLDFRERHELLVEFLGGGEEFSGNDLRVYRIDKQAAAARPPE